MTITLRWIIAITAIIAPAFHLLSDVLEWTSGVAFIYFAHTTLIALEESIPDYEMLWRKLGSVYTFHGGLMVGVSVIRE
jgi:hypothetical protein